MKAILISICILFAGASIAAAQQQQTTADDPRPEFVIEKPYDARSLKGIQPGNILIKLDGEIVKKFWVEFPSFVSEIARWKSIDADYVLLRTSMGNGSCASGTVYAIAFTHTMVRSTMSPNYEEQNDVKVSPALEGCLGEYSPVSFSYAGPKAETVIEVAGYVLRGDPAQWNTKTKWMPVRRGR